MAKIILRIVGLYGKAPITPMTMENNTLSGCMTSLIMRFLRSDLRLSNVLKADRVLDYLLKFRELEYAFTRGEENYQGLQPLHKIDTGL